MYPILLSVWLAVRLTGGVARVEEAVLVGTRVGVGTVEGAWGLRLALIRIARIVGIAALLLGLRLLVWCVCPVFRLALRLLSVAAILIRIVRIRVVHCVAHDGPFPGRACFVTLGRARICPPALERFGSSAPILGNPSNLSHQQNPPHRPF